MRLKKLELPLLFILTKNDLIRLVPRHLLQPEKALKNTFYSKSYKNDSDGNDKNLTLE